MSAMTPFDVIQGETRRHRVQHHCNAYTFEDGAGLTDLARSRDARHVLELGTALGYTACCLAAATETTRVDTIELDPQHVWLARDHIARAGFADRVTVHQGDFDAVMAGLRPGYDLAFFDGSVPSPAIVERLRDLLRDGGLLVCANVDLASGSSARALEDELSRADRWKCVGAIEEGSTLAFEKV